MIWRAAAFVFATSSIALASGPRWNFVQLVDVPLAPVERPTPIKILNVVAHVSEAETHLKLEVASQPELKPYALEPTQIIRGVPIPIAAAPRSRRKEAHRVSANLNEGSELQPLILPAR